MSVAASSPAPVAHPHLAELALAARVPKRALLIALMLVFALGNIASAFAPRFLSFVGLRFLALTVSDQKSVFLAQPLPALA
ncbi:MAG: hypothetical protein U9Q35_13115 [Pseudomonadota bacterium]|nr:hypothetical protein [Pseudomonadota bacterium]